MRSRRESGLVEREGIGLYSHAVCAIGQVAQLAEQEPFKLLVVGSSPTLPIFQSKTKDMGETPMLRGVGAGLGDLVGAAPVGELAAGFFEDFGGEEADDEVAV